MRKLQNNHALEIRFIGATNHKGDRIKIISRLFNQSVTISWNYNFKDTLENVEHYLETKGYKLTGFAEFGNSYIIFSDTFIPLKGKPE